MVDIFLSYASVDRPIARRLADALETRGWAVWWDHRNLRGGQHFDHIIEEAISAARVVIVIWSQNSIKSDWVRAEAAHALDENKLMPLRIEEVRLPLRFKNIHTIDLSSWTGETEAEPFEGLVEDLSHSLGPSNSSNRAQQPGTRTEPSSTFPAGRKRVGKYLVAVVVTGGVLLGVVVLEGRQQPPPTTPSEVQSTKPSEVQYFTWVYQFNPDPGLRIWSRDPSGIWHERYPDGRENASFSLVSRETVDNCVGAVVRNMKDQNFEVFIPDQGCDRMWARFRTNNGPWKRPAEMKDVR